MPELQRTLPTNRKQGTGSLLKSVSIYTILIRLIIRDGQTQLALFQKSFGRRAELFHSAKPKSLKRFAETRMDSEWILNPLEWILQATLDVGCSRSQPYMRVSDMAKGSLDVAKELQLQCLLASVKRRT